MSENSPTQAVRLRRALADYLGLVVALLALVAIFSFSTQNFFSATTFRTIANQIPSAMLIATGMTYVLIIAGIDLSVGSVLSLCGIVLGVGLVQGGLPLWEALLLALLVGAACGAFNGLVSIRWTLPSFIVTLGMMEIARGGAHFIAKSQTLYIGSKVEWIAAWTMPGLGLSLPFLVALVIVVAAQLVLTGTVFGRYLVAIGTNEEAVRLSGIDPRPVKLAVYVLTGLLVALAAIIDCSRFQSANPNAGTGFELQAIAAAVIGGTSLMGGRGSVLRTFFGVLIIAVLNNGLAAVGAKDETKRLVTGAVIIVAVVLDQYRQRSGSRRTAVTPLSKAIRLYGVLLLFLGAGAMAVSALDALLKLIATGRHSALATGLGGVAAGLLVLLVGRGLNEGRRPAVYGLGLLTLAALGGGAVFAAQARYGLAAAALGAALLLCAPPLLLAVKAWKGFR